MSICAYNTYWMNEWMNTAYTVCEQNKDEAVLSDIFSYIHIAKGHCINTLLETIPKLLLNYILAPALL